MNPDAIVAFTSWPLLMVSRRNFVFQYEVTMVIHFSFQKCACYCRKGYCTYEQVHIYVFLKGSHDADLSAFGKRIISSSSAEKHLETFLVYHFINLSLSDCECEDWKPHSNLISTGWCPWHIGKQGRYTTGGHQAWVASSIHLSCYYIQVWQTSSKKSLLVQCCL